MSKSIYKKIITESDFARVPRSDSDVIANNADAYDFFTSKRVFGEAPITSPSQQPFSSKEAQIAVEKDIMMNSFKEIDVPKFIKDLFNKYKNLTYKQIRELDEVA